MSNLCLPIMHDLFQATQKSDLRRVLVCVDFGALKQKTLTVNKSKCKCRNMPILDLAISPVSPVHAVTFVFHAVDSAVDSVTVDPALKR